MSVLSFFEACNNTAVAQAIRDSVWLFPAVEGVHLLALAVLGGTVLVVDLRLWGLGLTSESPDVLWRDIQPWLIGALAAMLTSGALLFASEAIKCYQNPAFWAKMAFLAPAILFTFTWKRHTLRFQAGPRSPWRDKVIASISVLLWLGVGAGGRAIGFY